MISLLFVLSASLVRQAPIDLKLAERYFQEAQWISEDDGGKLWGATLYGKLLFVDRATRSIVANEEPPEEGSGKVGSVFTGRLPERIGIANYSFKWKDQEWTMVMWPLPANRSERATLVMHELFHKLQPRLGIPQASPRNQQMETYDGRLWLQLELKALSEALAATDPKVRDKCTGDALIFRQMRYRHFPEAKLEEDQLELNEGLAQYTGYMLRGGWEPESRMWLANQLKAAIGLDTYARRFAYSTGTAYAFLLNVGEANRHNEIRWRKNLKPNSSLAQLTADMVKAELDLSDAKVIEQAKAYGYDDLVLTEGVRERERLARVSQIAKNYIDGAVLKLPLKSLNISFNPSNVFPMRELGTFYPTATLINEWGTLDVTDGVLISADFKFASIKAPKSSSDLTGPGWKLVLKPGWKIVPGQRRGDYLLTGPA